MVKLFAWDFHGVLEKNTERSALEITNRVCKEFNVSNFLTKKRCKELFGEKWINYFRELSPESSEKDLRNMTLRAMEISRVEQPWRAYIQPTDYAEEVLGKIKESGNFNIIISNTTQSLIGDFVDSVGLLSYFNDLLGVDNHHPDKTKPKSDALREYLEGKDIESLIMIGDHPRDIAAGLEIGATTYLFSRTGIFPKTNAHYEIDDLREVLREL